MPQPLSRGRSPQTLLFFIFLFTAASLLFVAPKSAYSQEKQKPNDQKVLINFVDVDIASVAAFISKITGRNFIYDESLAGKVTIVAPRKLDYDEAFDLFVSVLKLKGYSVVPAGSAHKIVPVADIKQSPLEVFGKDGGARMNESYIARIVPLQNLNGLDIVQMVQPLLSKEGYVSTFGKSNSLLVVDNAMNIDKVQNIIKAAEESGGYSLEIVYLRHTQAEALAQILRQIRAGIKPSRQYQDTVGPIADKRLNALIFFGTKEENEEYKNLVGILDVQQPDESTRVNVYNLENAEASEIARVLEGLRQPAQVQGAATDTSQKVAITPYRETNSLIITAPPDEYNNILQVIKKLDRRPRQVFVEAMITEISINKSLELGTKWRAAGQKDGKPIVIGGIGSVDSSTVQSVLSGMTGLTIGGLANYMTVPLTKPDGTVSDLTVPGFAALFSLSDFRGVVDVLSTPHILTSDNKEAEIMVGENVPFLSKIERETSSLNQPILQSIERRDVGITLRIRPQISEGGYIRLDIYQEISAVTPSKSASDIITTKRAAKTSIVVKDKQTVVIGGLIQDKEVTNTTKVPLLGDIPLIGWLFKSKSTEKQKTNLLVYLTPTIINEFIDLEPLKERKTGDYEKGLQEYRGEGRKDGGKEDAKEKIEEE